MGRATPFDKLLWVLLGGSKREPGGAEWLPDRAREPWRERHTVDGGVSLR